jgi:hypothetical protein|tara:strand:+ start:194 stop:436 length:243 start_codon:yes stop_codon:yes gene_type:complete
MRNTPLRAFANSQGLKPQALKDKRARDKAAAMTDKRKERKAENQRIGQSSNYDLHHKSDGGVIKTSTKNNRNVFKHGERK